MEKAVQASADGSSVLRAEGQTQRRQKSDRKRILPCPFAGMVRAGFFLYEVFDRCMCFFCQYVLLEITPV